MIYVKANVERVVSDPAEAKKLESQGFIRVDIPKQPVEASAEPVMEKPVEAQGGIVEEKPVEAQEAPVEAPKRRRRKAKE